MCLFPKNAAAKCSFFLHSKLRILLESWPAFVHTRGFRLCECRPVRMSTLTWISLASNDLHAQEVHYGSAWRWIPAQAARSYGMTLLLGQV